MRSPSSTTLTSILMATICIAAISGQSMIPKSKRRNHDKTYLSDDEGSGDFGNADGKNDMDGYSGSGYGDDDEDSVDSIKRGNEDDTPENIATESATLPNPVTTSTTTTTPKPNVPQDMNKSFKKEPENKDDIEKNKYPDGPEEKDDLDDKIHKNDDIPDNHLPDGSTETSDENTSINNNSNNNNNNNGVSVNTPSKAPSFFAQPGILAAVIGGAVVGLFCAILVVMFIVYRMRKKDEGSYPLEEIKRCPATNPYMKPTHREFFA